MTHPKNFWLLFAFATLSFLPALNFYYVGEEAIFPITSMEMWQRTAWLKQYLYGIDVQHNPLFNWLIMLLCTITGWEHVLLVTRTLTIAATLTTGLVLAWLAHHLFRDKTFAAFAAVAYISMADMLFYRGWLSYVDPLFAMFVFASISALWVAVLEQRTSLLIAAGLLLTCAFLSKAFTAYIFYGAALLVLLFEARQRSFLLRWPGLLIHMATLCIPLIWFLLIPSGSAQSTRMLAEILHKLAMPAIGSYLARLLVYPADILLWLAPVSVLAIYLMVRKRNADDEAKNKHLFKTMCWMVLLNFLPYWLSPQGGSRYLLPIYPLLALIAARVIWQSGTPALNLARKWIMATIICKIMLVLLVFPYYQSHYRGKNYWEAAADIDLRVQGYPLYVMDVSAPGLSVTAYLNQRRFPALQWPPAQWSAGFVLSATAEVALGKIHKTYRLGGDNLYLLCRGEACNTAPATVTQPTGDIHPAADEKKIPAQHTD